MVEKGTYEELLASSPLFSRLLENIHQPQEEEKLVPQNEYQTESYSNHLTTMTSTETDPEEVSLIGYQNFEAKQKGVVKWHVHISYLRAGAGLFFGVFLLILIFGFREASIILSGWWLAKWSEDERHRHQPMNNCSKIVNENINRIHSMNDIEWGLHRNNRFYVYCGKLIDAVWFYYRFFRPFYKELF